MKKMLLLLFVFTSVQLQAQVCEPDATYTVEEKAGVYPVSDSGSSPISTAYEGLPYEFTFTIAIPDSIDWEINPEVFTTQYLVDIALDTIMGLPPGLDYTCEPDDCIFLNDTSITLASLGCLLISGTPTDIGTYPVTIQTKARFGLGFVSLAMPALEYEMLVEEDSTTVNMVSPTRDIIGMRQNVPNPFSTHTEITIDSESLGMFDFRVYNLIGKVVHERKVMLSSGENSIQFNGSQLHAGLYFYAIGQGRDVVTRRMVVHRP
mgnify:CR=1 FL=1